MLCLSPAQSFAIDWWPFGHPEGIEYEIELEGVGDEAREDWLREIALTQQDRDYPPQTLIELEARAGSIAERIRKGMVAEGFYDARTQLRLEEGAEPAVLQITVEPGKRYRVQGIRLDWQGMPLDVPSLKGIVPDPGSIATADAIQASAARLEQALIEKHCLLRLEVTPAAELDEARHQAAILYRIAPGPKADFGTTRITGNASVKEDIIRKHIGWKRGECFRADKLTEAQTSLIKSQLFASVNLVPAETVDASGEVPIMMEVTERPHRTVSTGLSYATDEGIGVTAGWEHRNIAGRAQHLTAQAAVSELEYSIGLTHEIPYFYRDDQKLRLSGDISRETIDAYDSNNISLLASLERTLMPHVNAGVGLGLRTSEITQLGDTDIFSLVFTPVFAEWDNRDDALDPRRGALVRGTVTPYADIVGQWVSFLKTQVNGQTYLTASGWPLAPTLAVRGALGNISGASAGDVPPDVRFYAGGGGSVRGYSYQALGPRRDNVPLGGSSWTEVSAEMRLRFNDSFGGVAFLDGGNVYDDQVPDLAGELFWGAGAGVRYYSPIGPLRFDVAMPLDKREGDAAYQIYVSLGQSF